MSDEELKITIEPDEATTLPEVEVKKPEPEVKKAEEPSAVDALKAQVDEANAASERERKRREEIERRAAELEKEVATAHQRATASDLSTITTALEAAQSEIEQAKRDIRIAKAAGDVDAELDAIDRLTSAKTTALRLDEAKAEAETRKKSPVERKVVPPSDPVEAYVAGRTEPTANWIRQHPEYVTDQRKNEKLTAAHFDAVAEGYAPDSRRYFEHVEKFLGLTKDADTAIQEAKTQPKRTPAAPVAPAAAVANGGTPPQSNEVRLTANEARAATDGTVCWNYDDPKGKFKKGEPVGVQEYARRKLALQRSGAYDKSYTES